MKFVELDEPTIEYIAKTYSEAMCVDATFWETKRNKRYGTLMGIGDAMKLPPVRVSKFDRRAWIRL